MARKSAAAPNTTHTPTEAELLADKVRAERQARREAKAVAREARKALMKKPVMGPQTPGQKNKFGIAASASKATSFSKSIISRARGGRGR